MDIRNILPNPEMVSQASRAWGYGWLIALSGVAALMQSTPAQAEQLIREYSGERSTVTAEFEVKAPWILDWRVSGDFSDVVAVDVSLVNAVTGAHEGTALKTNSAGNGVRLFNEGGTYYFRVDASLMRWTLKVKELTKQEAALYTPKSRDIFE